VPGATAVLVAHGGLIAGLVCGLMALPTSTWPSIGGLGNCRWATLARRDDHPRWRLTGYNVGTAG
jgi:glucosyl-3-phosphoglycerate phosphatase